MTLCDDDADAPDEEGRNVELGAASGGAFDELANESVDALLSNGRWGGCFAGDSFDAAAASFEDDNLFFALCASSC
jgi:hypothetical protein